MTFSPFKTGGFAFGNVLTSAEMNALNTDFPFCVDGRSGGVYYLSGALGIYTAVSGQTIALNQVEIDPLIDGGGMTIAGAGGLSVSANLVVGGTAWAPRRILVETVDASRTLLVSATDAYVLPDSVWTSDHTIILSRSGAVDGVSELEVLNYDTARIIHVSDNGVGTLVNVAAPGFAGNVTRSKFLFFAGAWHIAS
ncbi:MAG TPA: hypothetical protein VIK01_29625 [Polyangiaceae bacterium]